MTIVDVQTLCAVGGTSLFLLFVFLSLINLLIFFLLFYASIIFCSISLSEFLLFFVCSFFTLFYVLFCFCSSSPPFFMNSTQLCTLNEMEIHAINIYFLEIISYCLFWCHGFLDNFWIFFLTHSFLIKCDVKNSYDKKNLYSCIDGN